MHETRSDPEKDPNATPISPIRGHSDAFSHIFLNKSSLRYVRPILFRSIYHSFYSSITRAITHIRHCVCPLVYKCTGLFCLSTPPVYPLIFYLIGDVSSQSSSPHRYFRQQIYSTDIYERRKEEVSSFEEETGFSTNEPRRIRKDLNKTLRDLFVSPFSSRKALDFRGIEIRLISKD